MVAAVAILVIAAVLVAGGGGPSEAEFRAAAQRACDRNAERVAQRTYIALSRKSLQAERTRVAAFRDDVEKLEAPEKARDEMREVRSDLERAIGIYDHGIAQLKRTSSNPPLVARVSGSADTALSLYPLEFAKAGVKSCDPKDSRVVTSVNDFRTRASRSCTQSVVDPDTTLNFFNAGTSRKAAKRAIGALRKDVRRADPGRSNAAEVPQVIDALYRKHLRSPANDYLDELDTAAARLQEGASPARIMRGLSRDYTDFRDDYLEGAYTMRLDGCLDRDANLRLRAASFLRRAKTVCRPASRELAKLIDRDTQAGFRAAEQKLGAILTKLRRLHPPYKRGTWRTALRDSSRVRGELDTVADRFGTFTATELDALSKRAEKAEKRAAAAFVKFGLTACARAV